MVNIKYKKYYVYFYILSLFLLITIIAIYKKSNKLLICVTTIILGFQLFIVYDTYTIIEPASLDQAGKNMGQMGKDIINMGNVSGQAGKTDLGNVYAEFNVINNKQKTKNISPLFTIAGMDGGIHTSFEDLSKKPISSFSEANIKKMIDTNQGIFMEVLGTIETRTLPK